MGNTIRINESALRGMIANSIKKVLKEDVGGQLYGMQRLEGAELFDRIDSYLSRFADENEARVSRFYSDEGNIVIASIPALASKVKGLMSNMGYSLYDSGSNDGYAMLTFRRMVAENAKRALAERTVPAGESEYNDENWDTENENIMCFDIFAKLGLSEDMRSELLRATLFDRYDKPVGKLNDLHMKYDPRNGRNGGLI